MKKWLKRIGYIIGGAVALLLLLFLFLQTDYGKKLLTQKLESYLKDKLQTNLTIGKIDYSIPNFVSIERLYVEDQKNDTLLYGGLVHVRLNMFGLLRGKYVIKKVTLEDINVNLRRSDNDSIFNYQFIVDAFASEEDKNVPSTDTTALALRVDELNLKNIRFNLDDNYSGNHTLATLLQGKLTLDKLDLDKQLYYVDSLNADQLKLSIIQTKENNTVEESNSNSITPIFQAKNISLNQSHVVYRDEVQKLISDNVVGQLKLDNLTYSNAQNQYNADSLQLRDAIVLFEHALPPSEEDRGKEDEVSGEPGYQFFVKDLGLLNSQVKYDNAHYPLMMSGVDYNHLDLKELVVLAKDVYIGNEEMSGNLNWLTFKDQSGFQIDTLSGGFRMKGSIVTVSDLRFITPNSKLAGFAELDLNAFGENATPSDYLTKIQIDPTIIGVNDVKLFVPDLYASQKVWFDQLDKVGIQLSVAGNNELLQIQTFQMQHSNLKLNVLGNVRKWTDPKRLQYDITIKEIYANDKILNQLPIDSINWPAFVQLKGNVKGDMNRLQTDLALHSGYGDMRMNGWVNQLTEPTKWEYDVTVSTTGIATGKWIYKEDVYGDFSGSLHVAGNGGTDLEKANVVLDLQGDYLIWEDRNVGPFYVNGNWNKGDANINAHLEDSLGIITIQSELQSVLDNPVGTAKIQVEKLDLQALDVYSSTHLLSFNTDVDIRSLQPESLDAEAIIHGISMETDLEQFALDTTWITAKYDDSTRIDFKGALLNGFIKSDVQYPAFADIISSIQKRYLSDSTVVNQQDSVSGTIVGSLHLFNNPIYNNLIPELYVHKADLDLMLTNQNVDTSVNLNLNVGRSRYGETQVRNIQANVFGLPDSLHLVMNVDSIGSGSFVFNQLKADAQYAQNGYNLSTQLMDLKDKLVYQLGVTGSMRDSIQTIKLKDNLVLDYEKWDVDDNNSLQISPDGLIVDQMKIAQGDQLIQLQSDSLSYDAPLHVQIKELKLSSLTKMFNPDTALVDGIMNADVRISDINKEVMKLVGEAQIDSMYVMGNKVGDILMKADMVGDQIEFDGKLQGEDNDVIITGTYTDTQIDADVKMNALSMKTIQALSKNNMRNSDGYLSGDIKLTGPVTNPHWNGDINFNGVTTKLSAFGSVLNLDKQTLELNYPSIDLNKFEIKDAVGNSMILNGSININEDFSVEPDLNIRTKEFVLMDSKQQDNEMLYGKAIVAIDGIVTGSIDAPVIIGDVTLKNGSNVTYVRVAEIASLQERDQWVEFIDMDTIPNLLSYHTKGDVRDLMDRQLPGTYMELDMELATEPKAILNVVIDPINKDKLTVQGDASINVTTNSSGDILMTGIYELDNGSYQFKYALVSKDFILKQGSTIQFNGNPMNAIADITAAYEIETTADGLIGNEISTGDGNTQSLRTKIPFEILLKIDGTITKPKLSFDIQMKEKAEGVSYEIVSAVENKLQQMRTDPSVMNKQVFSLLMLGKFVGEQSADFFGGAGNMSVDNILSSQSVSSFLNAAIDKIAEDLIRSVDIDVNIKNFENSQGNKRTDLDVALGSSFMNDRLNVTFGQRFTLDGQDATAKAGQEKNQFIPNIQTTYKLSRDGKYMLRAYRMNQYEAILDGYFIETGLTFTLKMDYDKFKEIFKKAKKKSE